MYLPPLENLKVERPALTQQHFDANYKYEKKEKDALKSFKERNLDGFKLSKWAKQTLPVLDWVPKYDWRVDGPCDLIAGITVGIMHIPQGLGYALLANVPPVVGIYMAFFPMIPYFFLGTSRHNSMGTFAVICLLVGKSVSTYALNPLYTHEVTKEVNGTLITLTEMYTELEIGTATTFYCAMWQLLLYSLRLGVVCTFLSDALVSSFITGAGVHIFTSQIKEIVGIKVAKFKGPFYMLYIYKDMLEKIWDSTPETRTTMYVALIISAISIALLVTTAFVIRPWLEKYTKVPFPAELILVVAGVYASVNLQLPDNYGIRDIGEIPTGLPGPQVPHVGLFSVLIVDSFVTAIVAYAVSMSMALILAEGEDYVVDPNQELLALGVGNLVNSFFSCVTFGASLSRSMVLRGVGGKTQFTGLIASGLIVIILLWIADYFEPLPRAILASIIIVALRKILIQVFDLPVFWRRSRLDGVVWIIVFLIVVIVDVDVGLGVGFLLSVGAVFMQGLKAYTSLLGHVPNTDLYLDTDRYKVAREVPGIKIVHYRGGLNFATRDSFKDEVIRLTAIDPKREARRRDKIAKNKSKMQEFGVTNFGFMGDNLGRSEAPPAEPKILCIILDLSALSSIDPAGSDKIKSLAHDYKQVDITVCIAGGSAQALEKMKKCELFEGEDAVPAFPTVHDAVVFCRRAIMETERL
ncbi:solute carrier family 26 member 6-like [Neocloeon triangulifer]|uniref:solute carrier family 26 member 6-like n=1 Tax=Neocloeon triangulifer TaxID=2078957 RepID=UPI00286F256D|nr:solute carrier family 26 member 6-like [Neocloeon triangulifer]